MKPGQIVFQCGECGNRAVARGDLVGQVIKCPVCGRQTKVSASGGSEVRGAGTIVFPCEWCRRPIEASADQAGTQVECPACEGKIQVPSESQQGGTRGLLLTTTPSIDGRQVDFYLGIVQGTAALGTSMAKDIGAAFRDVFGGQASGYAEEVSRARQTALDRMAEMAAAMSADAVVGIRVDLESAGANGSIFVASATGTAVRFASADQPAAPIADAG